MSSLPPPPPPNPNDPRANDPEPNDPNNTLIPRNPNQPIHRKPRVFIHRPKDDPEVTANTSYISALATVKAEDFTKIHQIPCFRDAVLPAIPTGLGLGAVRFVIGGSMWAAFNWSAGAFLGTSIVMFNYCQRQRAKEKDGIRRAIAILDEKKRKEDAAHSPPVSAPQAATSAAQLKNSDFWSSFKFW